MARTVLSRRRLSLALTGAGIVLLIRFVSNLFAFGDPWDAQGEANSSCIKTMLPSVSNENGWVVTAHRTDCDAFAHDSDTYVYLHRSDQPDKSYNLIFRYDGDDPELRWTDLSHVHITARHVSDVTKQVTRLWTLDITYDLQIVTQVEFPLSPCNGIR